MTIESSRGDNMILDDTNISGGPERVEKYSVQLEKIVNDIVDEHTRELTIIMHKVKDMLKDETDELTDAEIDSLLIQLPILLYDKVDDQELVGVKSDTSKQIYMEAYNEAYKLAQGTIADKKSVAELNATAQRLDTLIYSRAFNTIKQKLEMAIETLNAVKKVHASRQQRYNLSNFGNKF